MGFVSLHGGELLRSLNGVTDWVARLGVLLVLDELSITELDFQIGAGYVVDEPE